MTDMDIRLLSSNIASKIAAGEVVERPAAIVKELIENSLDAGATEVFLEVRGGGVESIRVADNGNGIKSDQVELAFKRFATSKVSNTEDLDAIETLGFRGEALPSIAAVSDVSIITRSAGTDIGVMMDIVDGVIVNKQSQGASQGTVLNVSNLFKNLPARRKFLRTTNTENSRIQAVVSRFALAFPRVRFQLAIENSETFTTSGSGQLREVIASVYGVRIGQAMLKVIASEEGENSEMPSIVTGMISPPSVDRANRNYISFFVNNRWVQNRMLGYALDQAYRGFVMEKRFPIVILNISMAYQDVDVNVHPAKSEVRFRREDQVFATLQQSVRKTLTTYWPVPEISHLRTTEHSRSSPKGLSATLWPASTFDRTSDTLTLPTGQFELREDLVSLKALPVLRVMGQVQNTYIVAEGQDGVYLIDQHAAHERVVFEKVRAELTSQQSKSQSVLEPKVIKLDYTQLELVTSHQKLLLHLGFLIEPFGDSIYLLRGIPNLLASSDACKAFVDVLDTMSEGGGFESWEERAAYSMACHSAVRAGKSLTLEEMSDLVRQLEQCVQPHTCPHGRPTTVHLTTDQLEREFRRR